MQSVTVGSSVVYKRELSRHGSDPHVQVGKVLLEDLCREEVLVSWPGIPTLSQEHGAYRPRQRWTATALFCPVETDEA